MMTNPIAFVFPGQGSQQVGMIRPLLEHYPKARQTLQEADDTLGFPLSKLMQEGPEDTLTLTEYAQPAILAASIAVVRVLEHETGKSLAHFGRMAAGHSLGEYSALVAVGAISLEDGVRLVHLRGQAMQSAVAPDVGLMLAVIGLEPDAIEEVLKDIHKPKENVVVEIANDNSPGQVVISGHKEAVTLAGEKLKEKGAKKLIPLQTSAPFHCSLMFPANVTMRDAFETVPLQAPSLPVVSNVTAQANDDLYQTVPLLLQQITHSVRWRESVTYMKTQGIETLVEVGHGNVLKGLTRRIDKSLNTENLATPEDIQKFILDMSWL